MTIDDHPRISIDHVMRFVVERLIFTMLARERRIGIGRAYVRGIGEFLSYDGMFS